MSQSYYVCGNPDCREIHSDHSNGNTGCDSCYNILKAKKLPWSDYVSHFCSPECAGKQGEQGEKNESCILCRHDKVTDKELISYLTNFLFQCGLIVKDSDQRAACAESLKVWEKWNKK